MDEDVTGLIQAMREQADREGMYSRHLMFSAIKQLEQNVLRHVKLQQEIDELKEKYESVYKENI